MKDGGNFNASDAVIALGVGKNMVSSIRYWLKVFGISNQDEPSRIADYLFDESEGVDKCLIREKVVTFRMVKLNLLLSIFLITK